MPKSPLLQNAFWFLGNVITSLIFSVPAKNIIILSKPKANPPCGGSPNLNAFCYLTEAPNIVDEEQLKELGIETIKKEDTAE